MRALLPLLALLLAASPAGAQQRVLTLEEALRTATERQPQLRQAQANTTAADARVDQNFAPLLPSEYQLRAQELQISATRGGYWPRLSASVSGSQAGADPTKLQWGLNGQVGLSWPLFEGGVTRAQVREQQANLTHLQAQRDAMRQQVRLEVERAQLAVNAARESVSATNAAVQRVQATYNLATARTELARALGQQPGPTG